MLVADETQGGEELATVEATVEPDDATLERGPLRRCIASGEILPKEGLLRFVVSPDGELLPDLGGKLPGRGLWLQPDPAMIRRALSRGLFSKAARAKVKVPDDLRERVAELERRRLLDLLGLARRAGSAVAGFDKVKTAIERGRVVLLFEATDGAAGGRDRLAALLAHCAPTAPILAVLEAVELGRALGREHAVHVAITAGGLAAALLQAANRVIRLNAGDEETESQDRRPGAVER